MPEYDNLPENLTRWQLVLKAAQELGKEIFTASDLVKKIHEGRPDVPATSIQTYVIAMAPKHNSYHHYPTHHPCFEYLQNGKYKLMPQYRLPLPETSTSFKETIVGASSANNTKEAFLQKHYSTIVAWTKENQSALIIGRKKYQWRDKSPIESLEMRNNLSRQIVLSRIRNNGGVDRETLDSIMTWGFPNPLFPERDEKRCLEITREAFNLLDTGKPSEAVLKLMSITGVGISRASKVIGLFDQNYLAIYDSRVGAALRTLTDKGEKMIKCPPGMNRPGDNYCSPKDWAENYEKLLWILEIIRNVLNEQGYPFNIADVEMALFVMGK